MSSEPRTCTECGTEYENWVTAIQADDCEGAVYLPDECDCYKCTEPEYRETEGGHREVVNNMEHHTYGLECGECGGARTEYKDLGRKGRFVCPEC